MSLYMKLGAAAVAIVAAVAVATSQRSSNGNAHAATNPSGPISTTSSLPTDSAPAPTEASPPAPTQVFASGMYGLSIKYPVGWKATAGIIPWTMDAGAYREPLGDLIEDPTHAFLWLKLASLPIGETPFDNWAASMFAGHGCEGLRYSVTIDGVVGMIDVSCHTALVASGGRGYFIGAHLCACELGSLQQWDAWFRHLLTTVQLQPEKAIDTR